jgi:tripartite-type tricarboxylate transporter receptor subunit TctC
MKLVRLAVSVAALALSTTSLAQGFPTKTIRIVVPYGVGGTADILGRALEPRLRELLGQAVIVENRPGGGGNVGADVVAKAAPDGHTLLLTATSLASSPSLYRKLAFDPAKDLLPVAQLASIPNIAAVNPALPINTIAELIAYAKANPGKLTFASAGAGTSSHLAMELFKVMAGVDLLHVPYKSAGAAMPDLIGNQVQVFFDIMPSTLPTVKSGKLRGIAVTSARRSNATPDLPTVAEAGVAGYEFTAWFGIFAPTGTPPAVIARLNTAINQVMQTQDMRDRLATQGAEVVTGTPEQFDAFYRNEVAKWVRVVRESKLPALD